MCTTKVSESAKKPVMVYVHGGSFSVGSSKEFSPKYLLEGNIVLVIPQYRLDALGSSYVKINTISHLIHFGIDFRLSLNIDA